MTSSVEWDYHVVKIKWDNECVKTPLIALPKHSICLFPLTNRVSGKARWWQVPIGFYSSAASAMNTCVINRVSPAPINNLQTHQYSWLQYCMHLFWGCIRIGLQVEPVDQDKTKEEKQCTLFHPCYGPLIIQFLDVLKDSAFWLNLKALETYNKTRFLKDYSLTQLRPFDLW